MSIAWTWRHAILKSNLPSTTRHVLLTLSCFMNDVGSGCYPTTKQLAEATGLSERAICTHLDVAHKAGWINRKRHGFAGQKWANHEYEPSFPEQKHTWLDDIPVTLEATDEEKIKARRHTSNGLAAGRVKRSKCVACGSEKTEAHHPDYSQPKWIIWLCRKHHRQVHLRDKKAAERGSVRTCEAAEPNDTKPLNEVQSNIPFTSPEDSVPNGTGETPDVRKQIWEEGLDLLTSRCSEIPERNRRTIIGKWCKWAGKRHVDLLKMIRSAVSAGTRDPIPYVEAAIRNNFEAPPDPRTYPPDKWRRMVDLVRSGQYRWDVRSMGAPPGHPECVCPKELITPDLIDRVRA